MKKKFILFAGLVLLSVLSAQYGFSLGINGELGGARLENRTTAPASAGRVWWSTLLGKGMLCSSTACNEILTSNIIDTDPLLAANSDALVPSQKAVKKYIDDKPAGALGWLSPVIAQETTPPSLPTKGDRYIVGEFATDAWATHENDIAEWNGAEWVFTAPHEGDHIVRLDVLNGILGFDGYSWFLQFDSDDKKVINQNQNLKLLGGGDWSFDLATETLSFTADAYLQVASFPDASNRISQSTFGSIVIEDGSAAYLTINRSPTPSSRPIFVDTISSIFISGDKFIIARRFGDCVVVGADTLICDGETKQIGMGGTPPGGLSSYVQFNSSGAFGGDSKFVYNTSTGALNLRGEMSGSTYVGEMSGNSTKTDATNNTFFGYQTGKNITTGDRNAFFGADAGLTTNGTDNTFLGYAAGRLSTGSYNTVVGNGAYGLSATGDMNTAIGKNSGQLSTGNNNTYLGAQAGATSHVGAGVTCLGYGACNSATSIQYNTHVGFNAGQLVSTGKQNSLFGYNSGGSLVTGSHNVFLGYNAGTTGTATSYSVAIGDEAKANASNAIAIGDGAVASAANDFVLGKATNNVKVPGTLTVTGSVSSPSLQKEFINNKSAEIDVTGWAAYADAAGASPVDGTGGSPVVTITSTTTEPLSDTASFLITKDASNRQGNGVSYYFTIDRAQEGKVLTVSFDYSIASGTYADGDITMWVYDLDYSNAIQLAPTRLLNNTGKGVFSATFQASTASGGANSRKYRAIFHVSSTSTSAYTLKFDNFSVSQQRVNLGAVITDWKSYTPVFSAAGGGASIGNGSITGHYRQIGDTIEVRIQFDIGSTTTLGSSDLRFSIPSGLTMSDSGLHGFARLSDSSTPSNRQPGTVTRSTNTTVMIAGTGDNINATTPFVWAPGDSIYLHFFAKIDGWSSSTVMSSDADTRVVAAHYYRAGSNQTLNGSGVVTILNYNTKLYDTHGAVSVTTDGASSDWKFTAPVRGYYRITATMYMDAPTGITSLQLYAFLNGATNFGMNIVGGSSGSIDTAHGSTTLFLNAGEYVQINGLYAGSLTRTLYASTFSSVKIERISGPEQIAASETVVAKYGSVVADSIPTSEGLMQYNSKLFDSHNAVTTGASWRFTAPISGTYRVTSFFKTAAFTTGGAGRVVYTRLYVNGINSSILAHSPAVSTGTVRSVGGNGSTIIRLLAGDYIAIYGLADDSGVTLSAGTTDINWVSIERVGNY